ncbi:MAG: hypothetical protein ACETVO_05870 [bacterium]
MAGKLLLIQVQTHFVWINVVSIGVAIPSDATIVAVTCTTLITGDTPWSPDSIIFVR